MTSTLPRWASRAVVTGFALSVPVPVAVALVALFPDLKFGYPLVLLPLLAAGPIAVVGCRMPRALLGVVLAGLTSAIVAAGSLAVGSQLLGTSVWTLTSAASAPPMPPLPRLAVLPMSVMSWAQQDVLFFQPIMALALGLLALLLRSSGRLVHQLPPFLLPRSVRVRLMLATGGLLALSLLVGWVGFSSLEEMHFRGHVLQLHADWKRHLSDIEASLDAERAGRVAGRDEPAQVLTVQQQLAHLADAGPHPGISVSAAGVREIRDRYQPALDLLAAAYAAQRARPDDPNAIRTTHAALTVLRRQTEDEVQALTADDDVTHHQRLIALMMVVGLAGAVGLWLCHWTVAAIDVPIRQAIAHLARVSRGDFSRRAPRGGPAEFQSLAGAVDSMSADLDRLYSIERAGRQAAEVKFVQEQVLTGAGTALVAASDRTTIYQVAARAAVALARHPERTRATVAVGPVERLAVVSALGENAAETLGAHMDLRKLLDGPNLELQQRRFRATELGVPAVIGMLGFRPWPGTIILTTLFVRGGQLTTILLDSDDTLNDECDAGLAKLGVEVALALDNATFNEDLLARRSEARFRSLVQNSTDVVTILGPDGVVQYQSPSGVKVFGYDDAALLGMNLRDLIHPSDVLQLHTFLADVATRSETTPRVEWRVRHADGSWIHTETVGNNLLDDPDVCGLVLNSRDIGDRRALQDQLTYQAFHDPLTTLPNRSLFMDRLEHALIRADRRENAVAMLFLDLDNFKVVNDSLGHQAGDQLLVAVAERLVQCVRAEDTVARLGGDEFTILIEDIKGLDSALDVADRIDDQLRAPFTVFGHEVFSTASIGIAVSGPRVGSSADLLRDADLAMYRAKREGRARHVVFDGAMNAQAMKRLELETALRRAVERNELRLVYQPIMSLESMGIDRVETLVRWQHPERGLISPADFIPLAEETGLIVPIGQWVLSEACLQARLWQREFPSAPDLVMSVNLSPRQFQHPALVEDIARILRDSGLAPERLELEITEGAVMEDADAARATLQKLRDIGISLAIDDFGTGYSSLGYLKRFPVNVLKIDQSFVRGLGHDTQDLAIVRGVIALARSLNLSVTAEGIETFEQLAHLRDLGCNHGQGYLLSRPLDSAALGHLLARSTVQLPSPKHSILLDRRRAAS
jgi:diguanylate cyclase (GGDEF)-like protein/PAS domain S-box-containing protein